jgi:hypothetical protein
VCPARPWRVDRRGGGSDRAIDVVERASLESDIGGGMCKSEVVRAVGMVQLRVIIFVSTDDIPDSRATRHLHF